MLVPTIFLNLFTFLVSVIILFNNLSFVTSTSLHREPFTKAIICVAQKIVPHETITIVIYIVSSPAT